MRARLFVILALVLATACTKVKTDCNYVICLLYTSNTAEIAKL